MSSMGAAVAGSSPWRPALRPAGEVAGFGALFLVLSLLGALPFALVTGKTVLGIWYILPFTLLFVVAYQKLVHKEGVRELGLDSRARYVRYTVAGFLGSGLGVMVIQVVQFECGWTEIRSINVLTLRPEAVLAGVGLALAVNLGIGVGEELIYRGYVLRRLLLGYRACAPAVLISSLVFSAAHIPKTRSTLVLLNLFLLGIVLALAVVLTRSLWASVGIHMGWDFWSDGVYFRLPGVKVSHAFTFVYHLRSSNELLAFKMITAVALGVAASCLILRIRRQQSRRLLKEEVP